MKIRVYDEKRKIWDTEPVLFYPGEEIKKQGRVIQFFTGITDSTGQEIYEGDIIKDTWKENHPYGYCPDEWYDRYKIFEVKYSGCSFNLEHERSEAQICVENFHRKIIGNIFDNPELLKKS